jgi:hypothetical protein
MNRERLLSQLLKLREHQLRGQTAELKAHAGKLAEVKSVGERARTTAADTLALPDHLGDLGAIGAKRLQCIKLATQISRQVSALGKKVGRARKLADNAREARAHLRRIKAASLERSLEAEAEQFFAWKNDFKPER